MQEEERNQAEPEQSGLTDGGYMATFVAVWRKAWSIAGQDVPEWDLLDSDIQVGLYEACKTAIALVEAAENTPFQDIAAKLWVRYETERTERQPTGAFEQLPLAEQLVWECLVRHTANVTVYDANEDGSVQDHEDRITDGWLRSRLDLLSGCSR